jgi:hypothetical protein
MYHHDPPRRGSLIKTCVVNFILSFGLIQAVSNVGNPTMVAR